MELSIPPDDQAFLEEAGAFLATQWRARVRGLERSGRSVPSAVLRAWREALVVRGWAVPDWPVAWGGTGWSRLRRHLWARARTNAGAPGLDPAGVELAGPALWRFGTVAQQVTHLEAIRSGRATWCLGLAEAATGWALEQTATTARREPRSGGLRVRGAKAWVAGASAADWMLTLVVCETGAIAQPEPVSGPTLALLIVPLTAPGISITPLAGAYGARHVAAVALDDVQVAADALIGPVGAALDILQAVQAARADFVLPGPGLASAWRRLVALADELPGDSGRLAEDAGFSRKLAAIGVELAGLEALEWRHVTDAPFEGPLRDTAVRSAALRVRGTQLRERIGALARDAFGYFWLPAPDPLTVDNEGPIGHHYALAALQAMLTDEAPVPDDPTGTMDLDQIARHLTGF